MTVSPEALERAARAHYESLNTVEGDDASLYEGWDDLGWHTRQNKMDAMKAALLTIPTEKPEIGIVEYLYNEFGFPQHSAFKYLPSDDPKQYSKLCLHANEIVRLLKQQGWTHNSV